MTSPAIDTAKSEQDDFSIVLGGPLYNFYLKSGLARTQLHLLPRRIAVITLFVWLPLLVLSLLDGTAFGSAVQIPFLFDIAVQVKCLVALPLFIAAEILVHRAIVPTVHQFEERAIVRDGSVARFRRILESSVRLRNSAIVEFGLIALVYTVGHAVWRQNLTAETTTWFAQGKQVTRAGFWYAWVAAPILQFLLLRWYFRLLVWGIFLWRVSRLDLHLVPTHPDGAAGLGFLNESLYAFALLPFAQACMMSALLAERIFYHGAKLTEFKGEIGTLLVVMILVFLGPLSVFSRKLWVTKIRGLRQYGRLGSSYVLEFDRKWLHGGHAPDEALVGSADIQSLADLSGSYDVVRGMRPTPFGLDQVVFLAIVTAAPIVPLVLTMIPLEELIKKVAGALF